MTRLISYIVKLGLRNWTDIFAAYIEELRSRAITSDYTGNERWGENNMSKEDLTHGKEASKTLCTTKQGVNIDKTPGGAN